MALSNQAFLKNLVPSDAWDTFVTEVAAIATGQVPAGSISTAELADNAVTVAKMAATLDLSSNTVTLGTIQISGATTIGVDDTGYDFKAFGATSGAYMLWDESADSLLLVGGAKLNVQGEVTVGVDDTGYDVKLFGATASAYLLWDESADSLVTAGLVKISQADALWAAATTTAYFRSSCSATTGEHIALRARAESEAAGAATGETRGFYSQGVANASLYAGHVTGIFGNAIAKDASTSVTIRAGFFEAETEATPTEVANMYGIHTRTKAHIAPTTAYAIHLLETEKMATGFPVDAFLSLKTITWAAGDTIATALIDAPVTGTVTSAIRTGANLTATNFIEIDGSDTCTTFAEFSAAATDKAVETNSGTPSGAVAQIIRVTIAGTPGYIPVYASKPT